MTDMQSTSDSPERNSRSPFITRVTRRQFVALTGGALACGSAAALINKLSTGRKATEHAKEMDRIALPPNPSHNPAFQIWSFPDGSVVLATHRREEFLGYRLNGTARALWELCDGSRSADQIAQRYAKQTGRLAGEGGELLRELMNLAVVATGGYIVPIGDFVSHTSREREES